MTVYFVVTAPAAVRPSGTLNGVPFLMRVIRFGMLPIVLVFVAMFYWL